MGVTTSSPHLRCASPDDLDAVRDLLTDVFLVDPLMSTIIGAAPSRAPPWSTCTTWS